MSHEEQFFAGLVNKRKDYRQYLEATADPLERARLIGFIQGLSLAIDDMLGLLKMRVDADANDTVNSEGAPCSPPSSSGSSRSSSVSSPPA